MKNIAPDAQKDVFLSDLIENSEIIPKFDFFDRKSRYEAETDLTDEELFNRVPGLDGILIDFEVIE